MSLFKEVRGRHRIYPAWATVRSAGLRSPAKATRTAIAQFGDGVPRNIEKLQEELRKGSFQFGPGTGIPVPRTGKSPRPIVVQDVRDRIVQRSLLDVVMSIPNVVRAVDNGVSFGGVLKRSVKEALAGVSERVNSDWAQYFIRSDISEFFSRMPREKAVTGLVALLPDDSLDDFIDRATMTELANHAELGHLLDYFPDEITGVAQGHALSALLGNLLLQPLDEAINSDGAVSVRYLDDFLILAPDKGTAWKAFRRARRCLSELGLICYRPGQSPKADEGSAQRMFTFLGCEVSRGFLRPSAENRRKLLDRVQDELFHSARRMTGREFRDVRSYTDSVATTLVRVSRMLRGWAEQYSFCRYSEIRADMDRQVDAMLQRYLGLYADRRQRADTDEKRRMVGVWLLADAAED